MEGSVVGKARIAVVTGGNKGIGLEVCRQLAVNGVAVVLTARDETRGAAAVDKLKAAAGLSDVTFHQLDVTDASSIARLADFLSSRFGKLDILVNNAGIGGVGFSGDPSLVEQLSGMEGPQRLELMMKHLQETYDSAKECIQTNYYGVKRVTEALLPLLLSSSEGRIVNISSDLGLLRLFRNEEVKRELNDIENLTEGRLDELLGAFLKDFEAGTAEERGWPPMVLSAYKVAKAAMNSYSRVLARRHPELRVNCVDPGFVKTDLNYNSGTLTPEEAASKVVAVALQPGGGVTGALFANGKETSFV